MADTSLDQLYLSIYLTSFQRDCLITWTVLSHLSLFSTLYLSHPWKEVIAHHAPWHSPPTLPHRPLVESVLFRATLTSNYRGKSGKRRVCPSPLPSSLSYPSASPFVSPNGQLRLILARCLSRKLAGEKV